MWNRWASHSSSRLRELDGRMMIVHERGLLDKSEIQQCVKDPSSPNHPGIFTFVLLVRVST